MSASNSISLEQLRSALSAAGDPWEAGVTSVSSLTPEQQKNLLGVTPPPGEPTVEEIAARIEAQRASLAAAAVESVGAPSAYDLRNVAGKNFVTPIRDQDGCGSCVAFGTTGVVESQVRVQRGDPNLAVDLSESHLFFCLGKSTNASCNGWWPQYAFDAYRDTGVADEACYTYASGLVKKDCSGLCADWASRVTRITGYTVLTGKPGDMKTWVSTKGPVSACMVVYDDFFKYKSGVYKHVSGGQAGGHCVTIVGYSDTERCWICKNSWGTGWGDSGFFKIAYGECGIDTWLNHGVNAIRSWGWQSNRRVLGLWAIDQDRNAWVYFDGGIGWRRVAADNDNVFLSMLAQLISAKAAARPVNFYEEDNVIKQVYVF